MSRVRTQPTESARKRDVFTNRQVRGGRRTRAEILPAGSLLEYKAVSGGNRKWPSLFYGGETTAGEQASRFSDASRSMPALGLCKPETSGTRQDRTAGAPQIS